MSAANSATVSNNVRNVICPSLPFASYHSPPFPVFSGGAVLFAFLIGRGEGFGGERGYRIWNPHLLALFDGRSGAFTELRRIEVAANSGSAEPDQPVQKGVSPGAKEDPEYIGRWIRLCAECDTLVASAVDREQGADAIARFDAMFRELAEECLHPVYGSMCLQELRE